MTRTQALLLNAEIASVLSSMRQNAKWALIPKQYTQQDDDEIGDDPLLEDFRQLRRRIFRWPDWPSVRPLEYMQPFLEVIRSSETSGPITGVALTSIRRILDLDIIGLANDGIAEAMCATADSITQCKFEATDPASDEVVLYKILQVLSSCVRCAAGCHLTDGNVVDIFNACFRIGHYQTERSKDMSELQTQAARQIMLELGATIFTRLGQLPEHVPGVHSEEHHLATSRLHPPTAADLGDLAAEEASGEAGGKDVMEAISQTVSQAVAGNGGEQPAVVTAAAAGSGDGQAASDPDSGDAVPVPEGTGTKAAAHDWGGERHTVSVAGPAALSSPRHSVTEAPTLPLPLRVDDDADAGFVADACHGLPAAADILVAVVSYVSSGSEGVHTDLNEFGLELLCVILNAGGSAFERHGQLMDVIQEDLFAALSVAACAPNLACLSGACQVALALYCHLGQHLLLQLEAFLSAVLLQLADGKGIVRIEQQEAALEGVLDLCNQPSFVRNVYLNMDCRIERSNLFATTAVLLSKTATPAPSAPLGSVNLLSLEGLVAIVSALADSCLGPSSGWDPKVDAVVPPVDTTELRSIWAALISDRLAEPLASGGGNGLSQDGGGCNSAAVAAARREKAVKQRLVVAAEHFNRDHRKGLQYLQAMGLQDEELDPTAVAHFLRRCPGLSKATIGELLGEPAEFWLNVLSSFVATFDFSGLDFDSSLRMLLQSFRLPGEAQKISRILENFAARYFELCHSTFATADAAYILSYSVIMLNTDLHNKQVKQKMTLEQFYRNNRGINDSADLPNEFLQQIYNSIKRNEIKLKEGDASSVEVAPVVWTELQRASQLPRGAMIDCPLSGCSRLERDMLTVVWAPTLAAVSVVLGRASDPEVVSGALSCLMRAAFVAAYHGMDEEMDSLLASLTDYTSVLEPASSRAVVAFGESDKARGALQAVFEVANRYGGSLREMGWRAIMTWIVRLGRLGLLPEGLLMCASERPATAKARLPKPAAPSRSSSSGSMLSRALNTFISGEGSQDGGGEVSEREASAWAAARGAISAAGVEVPFSAASAQLPPASLQALVASMVWGAEAAASSDGSESAELCLELLFTMAVHNADRVHLIWPPVHDALAEVLSPQASAASGELVSRATSGLLRVAPFLIGRSQAATSGVLRSLQLLFRLHPDIAWDLAEPMAAQILRLVEIAGPKVQTVGGWHILCTLITNTSARPEACGTALAALREAASRDSLSLAAYQPCLTGVQTFINSQAKKDPYPNVSLQALDVLEVMCQWLGSYGKAVVTSADDASAASERSDVSAVEGNLQSAESSAHPGAGSSARPGSGCLPARQQAGGALWARGSRDAPPTLEGAWLITMAAIIAACKEPNIHVRGRACVILTGMVTCSDGMQLSGSTWLRGLSDLLLPLVTDLNARLLTRARDFPDAGKTIVAALGAVSKALLLSLPRTAPLSAFPALWLRLLEILRECIDSRSDELSEHVPEALKNMLNVMSASHMLVPGWQDAEGNSMWDATWARAREVSSGLGPQMLQHVEPRVRHLQPPLISPSSPSLQSPHQSPLRSLHRQQSPQHVPQYQSLPPQQQQQQLLQEEYAHQGSPRPMTQPVMPQQQPHQQRQHQLQQEYYARQGSPQPIMQLAQHNQQLLQIPPQQQQQQQMPPMPPMQQQQQAREDRQQEDPVTSPAGSGLPTPPAAAATAAAASDSSGSSNEPRLSTQRRAPGANSALLAVIANAQEYLEETGNADDNGNGNGEDHELQSNATRADESSRRHPEQTPSPRHQPDAHGKGPSPAEGTHQPGRFAEVAVPVSRPHEADVARNVSPPAGDGASCTGISDANSRDEGPQPPADMQQEQRQAESPQQQQPLQQSPSLEASPEKSSRPGWLSFF